MRIDLCVKKKVCILTFACVFVFSFRNCATRFSKFAKKCMFFCNDRQVFTPKTHIIGRISVKNKAVFENATVFRVFKEINL